MTDSNPSDDYMGGYGALSDTDIPEQIKQEREKARGDIPIEELEVLEQELREKVDALTKIAKENDGVDNWAEIGQIEILADKL